MIETVEISKLHYFNLLLAEEKLSRLRVGGVDNWEGYGRSLYGDEYIEVQDWDEFEEELKAKVWGNREEKQ